MMIHLGLLTVDRFEHLLQVFGWQSNQSIGASMLAQRIAGELCDELDLWKSFLTKAEAINRVAAIVEKELASG